MKRFAVVGLICTLAIAAFAVGQPTPREVREADAIVAKWAQELGILKEEFAFRLVRAPDDPVKVPEAKAERKFKTGARRTPLDKVMRELAAGRIAVHFAAPKIPVSVAMVPKTLSMLGNDQYGDCVTSESCFAIEAYSVYVGLPEIVITDAAAIAWARAHGVLNGADLLSVMQAMGTDGIKDSTGTLRKAGVPSSVDYTNATTLQSAIAVGPVSIAIGSGDLPSDAGNVNGWYALTSTGAANDHDVDLCGFGKAEVLYAALNMPCPAACAGKTGYLCYTWSTIGFVTQAWVNGTVEEAWVRTPTTVGLSPPPSPPVPPVPPIPPGPGPTPGPYQTITITQTGTYWLVPEPQTDADRVQLIKTMFVLTGAKGFLPPLVPEVPTTNDARWTKQEQVNGKIADALQKISERLDALTPKKP